MEVGGGLGVTLLVRVVDPIAVFAEGIKSVAAVEAKMLMSPTINHSNLMRRGGEKSLLVPKGNGFVPVFPDA